MAAVAGDERDEANHKLSNIVNADLLDPINKRILIFLGDVEVTVIKIYLLLLLRLVRRIIDLQFLQQLLWFIDLIEQFFDLPLLSDPLSQQSTDLTIPVDQLLQFQGKQDNVDTNNDPE